MLVLDDAGHPGGPEATCVEDHHVSFRNSLVHQIGDQIAQIILVIGYLAKEDLIFDKRLEEWCH